MDGITSDVGYVWWQVSEITTQHLVILIVQATLLVRFLKLWNQTNDRVTESLTKMAIRLFGYLHQVLQWGTIRDPARILLQLPTLKLDVMFVVQLCPEKAQAAVRLLQLLYQHNVKPAEDPSPQDGHESEDDSDAELSLSATPALTTKPSVSAQTRPALPLKSPATPLLSLATEVSIARQLLGQAATQRVADLQQLEKEKLSQQLCFAQDRQRKSAQDRHEALAKVDRLKARLQEAQELYNQLLSEFEKSKDTRTVAVTQPAAASPAATTSAAVDSNTVNEPRATRRDRPEDDDLIVRADSKTHPRDIQVKQCRDFIDKIRCDWEGLEERRRGWDGALRHLGPDLYSNPLHFVNEILQNIGDNEFDLPAGQDPQIRIELGRGYFMFSSNERGFRRKRAWFGCRGRGGSICLWDWFRGPRST